MYELKTGKEESFVIHIVPQAKQSTYFAGRRCFTPKKKQLYLDSLQGQIEEERSGYVFTGPTFLEVVFIFPYNKAESKDNKKRGWYWKITRPDLDNLEKPLDALVKAGVLKDDSLVVAKKSLKVSNIESDGCLLITLKELLY